MCKEAQLKWRPLPARCSSSWPLAAWSGGCCAARLAAQDLPDDSRKVKTGRIPAGRCCHFSEHVLQSELNLAIRQAGVVDLPHGRRIKVIHRDVEVPGIEQVEKIFPGFNVLPF